MRKNKAKLRFLALTSLFAATLSLLCPWTVPIGSVGITLATCLLLTFSWSLPITVSLTASFVYLALGAIGIPIFSHFTGGFAAFTSPSGGFLIGYLPFVAIAALARRSDAIAAKILSALAAHLALYAVGCAVFAAVGEFSLTEAVTLSVLPFLIPDIIKTVIALYLSRLVKRRLSKVL